MSDLLRGILAAGKEGFNRKVLLARKARPGFEADSLARLLKEALAPLVEALSSIRPDLASCTATEGFDLSLEIAGLAPARQGHLAGIVELWTSLSSHPEALSASPGRTLARATNAFLFLRAHDGFRPEEWLSRIRAMEPDPSPLDDRLAFLAWVCGFAPLRSRALESATGLESSFLEAALGCRNPSEAVAGLRADPWWVPGPRAARIAYRLGGFEGFDGLFGTPPAIATDQNDLSVRAGSKRFRLHADRFGAVLLPIASDDPPQDVQSSSIHGLSPGFSWNGRILVSPNGSVEIPFPETDRALAVVNGVAVVTSPLSFSLLVVAP